MSFPPTLSLCMITYNEEENLRRCLNSVSHLVDEIIIADTGSTDRTREIAQDAGSRLFVFAWKEDFSQARNFSLQQACGDWILILDADEVLQPVTPAEIKKLLADSEAEGYFLQIKNFHSNGTQFTVDQAVRLFRNRPGYRFHGALHEQIAPSILCHTGGKGLKTAPLLIYHYGYLDRCLHKKEKARRNLAILHRTLQKDPNDPFLLYCLGLEYYQQGEIEKGLDYLRKAIPLMEGSEGYFENAIVNVALGFFITGQTEKLQEFTRKALLMFPHHPVLVRLNQAAKTRASNEKTLSRKNT